MDSYELLKTIHVLAIAAWFGGGLVQGLVGERARRRSREERRAILEESLWAGGRFYPAAAAVALVTGILMVVDHPTYGFADPWITIAMTGWLLASLNGGLLVGRAVKAAIADDAAFPRVLVFTRLDSLLLALIVADMVIKPGG